MALLLHRSADAFVEASRSVQLGLLVPPELPEAEQKRWRRSQLQIAVARVGAVQPVDVELAANAMGQVSVRPTSRIARPPAVSLSDAHGLVAVAVVSEGAVGVDVEELGSVEHVRRAFATFATEHERADLLRVEAKERALLAWWTAKEALLKALGTGIRLGPEGIALRRRAADTWEVASLLEREELARGWRLLSGEHAQGASRYVWTVAASTGDANRD